MKKRILQWLTILAVNIVLSGLVLASFLTFVFNIINPRLAAVPAIVALPGILLQPWFIAFFLLPGGPVLAPVLTTVVSASVYISLDRKGKLEGAKRVLTRIKRQAMAVSGAVIVLLVLVAFAIYKDFPPMHKGTPQMLQHWTKDMDLDHPRYYWLGGFIDSEWLWQARLPEQDVDTLSGKLGMDPIEPDQISDHYLQMPPYWWRPVISARSRAFATPHFPIEGRGPDGWHALATWNPEDQTLHMWVKDNF